MLHNNIPVFNMIEFNFGRIVKADQKSFIHKKLDNLFISFEGEYFRFVCLVLFLLDLVEVYFIFVGEDGDMGLIYVDMFYGKFAIYLVYFFNIVEDCALADPAVEFYGVSTSCC